jgi:DNA-binding NarL/FixJ family response regulator
MNIVIAEDHVLIVDGLRSLLESNGYVVHHASDELVLMNLLRKDKIDVLIQDIRFGKVDARTIIPTIREQFPEVKILVLTSLDDLASIQSVLATNIQGYIIKTEPSELILEAIEIIVAGKTYLSPEVQSLLVGKAASAQTEVQLSERETGVLNGILDEKSTKEIAEILYISEKTVEHYRSSLFTKFDVKNVSGLVKKAILLGFYKNNSPI